MILKKPVPGFDHRCNRQRACARTARPHRLLVFHCLVDARHDSPPGGRSACSKI